MADDIFDPFADLPEPARESARQHMGKMQAIGLHLIRFDTKREPGGFYRILYFGDGKTEDLVTISLFMPG